MHSLFCAQLCTVCRLLKAFHDSPVRCTFPTCFWEVVSSSRGGMFLPTMERYRRRVHCSARLFYRHHRYARQSKGRARQGSLLQAFKKKWLNSMVTVGASLCCASFGGFTCLTSRMRVEGHVGSSPVACELAEKILHHLDSGLEPSSQL